MNMIRYNATWRSWSLSLTLLFIFTGPGILVCRHVNAEIELPVVKITFKWNSYFYEVTKRRNPEDKQAYVQLEENVIKIVKDKAYKLFPFVDWSMEGSVNPEDNEWIVELETVPFGDHGKEMYEKITRLNRSKIRGTNVYVNQKLKIGDREFLLIGNDKNAVPILNHQITKGWGEGSPPDTPAELYSKLKSTISRQLPLILAEEKVETELKNIPIKEPGLTFKSDKKRFEIQATFCDLGLMPNAEFRVKLKVPNDGSDTDYYWFMDSSDDEPENINGPVIKGVDKSAEGWVERLKDKVNDPESQVIVTLDAYVASGIDCEKVSSEMLAIAPAEPDAAS